MQCLGSNQARMFDLIHYEKTELPQVNRKSIGGKCKLSLWVTLGVMEMNHLI